METIEKRPRGRPRKYFNPEDFKAYHNKSSNVSYHREKPLKLTVERPEKVPGRPVKYMDRAERLASLRIEKRIRYWCKKVNVLKDLPMDEFLSKTYGRDGRIIPMDDFHKEALVAFKNGEQDIDYIKNLISVHQQSKSFVYDNETNEEE